MVTTKDIAKAVGVTDPTVSSVLSGRWRERRISENTSVKILATARRLGYVPNQSARSLKSGKTHTIITATREALHHPYVHELIEELQAALARHGYQMMLESIHRVADDESVYASFVPGRCDGVVVLQLPSSARRPLEAVQRRGIPVVAIEPGGDPSFSCIDYDRVVAARIGVEHLLKLGHKRVALVTDVEEGIRRQQRVQGYRAALEQFGIEFDRALLFPQPVESDARELWLRMAALQRRPTAVLCYNDELTVRLLLALGNEQIRVPEDMALVSQGNSRMTTLVEVPLTAVDANNQGIATAVVDVLLERFRDGQAPPRQVLVKPFLVARASSGGNNR